MQKVNEADVGVLMSGRPKKSRLDDLIVSRELAHDRDTAARLVMAGQVSVTGPMDGTVLTPGMLIGDDEEVTVREQSKFVSRGGLKLERALEEFGIDVTDMVALDIGASTGGFTDCLLQRGASRVYAVDAGRGQLHNRLLTDSRVTSMERTNARNPFGLPEIVDIIVADVSFISLLTALPPCLAHLKRGGVCVALLKPQFEARRDEVGKGGVIRDNGTFQRIVARFIEKAPERGLKVTRTVESPVRGDKGNRELMTLLEPVSHVDPSLERT